MNRFSTYIFDSGAGTGSWTAPAGVTRILVSAMGGGGGGAAGRSGGTGNGGGGGAAVVMQTVVLSVTPNTTYNISIGAGGIAGVVSSGAGGVGGNTTFGALMTWYGAGGGVCTSIAKANSFSMYSTPSSIGVTGTTMMGYATGGVAAPSGDTTNLRGHCGYTGLIATATAGNGRGGSGASGEKIGGAAGVIGSPGSAPDIASGAGGGGGVGGIIAPGAQAGGAGGSGKMIIMWVE